MGLELVVAVGLDGLSGPTSAKVKLVVEMFSPDAVRRGPTDIELVREVTLQQISEWLIRRCQGLPEHLMKRIRDLDTLRSELSPIFNEMQDGDSLWLCQSQFRAALWGHEGIALVRDKRPFIYIPMWNH